MSRKCLLALSLHFLHSSTRSRAVSSVGHLIEDNLMISWPRIALIRNGSMLLLSVLVSDCCDITTRFLLR